MGNHVNHREPRMVVEVHPFDPRVEQMGGGIRFVKGFASFLRRRGVQTVVVGVQDPKARSRSRLENFRPVYQGQINWLRFAFGLFVHLRELVPEHEALVHIHHPLAALPFIVWRRKNAIVCTIHGQTLSHSFRGQTLSTFAPITLAGPLIIRTLIALEELALRRCAIVTAVGVGTADFIRARHPSQRSRVKTVQTGVDRSEFRLIERSTARAQLGWQESSRIVLVVGRLTVQKNLPLLLDAYRIARSRIPDLELIVAGDGEQRTLLKPLVDDDHTHILGTVVPSRIPVLMNAADVLVLSSTWEGDPFVVKEAISCGLFVVSTPAGDAAAVLHDERLGVVVDWDATALGGAMVAAVQRPDSEQDRRYRSEASARYSAHKTWDGLWRCLVELDDVRADDEWRLRAASDT